MAAIYETVIYASDIPATVAFYRDLLGLRPAEEPNDLMAVFRLEDGGVLLLFDPERASEPGRPVPSHGTVGAGHVAFSVEADSLAAWGDVLRKHGVEIEREVTWQPGARSLYVRDPAGNSVELVEGDLWPK